MGKGYSSEFVAHMTMVQEQLKVYEDTVIELADSADALCAKCPHRRGEACESGQKVKKYDRSVMELCGLEPGMELSWKEFSVTVKEKILETGSLERVCGDCEWFPICSKTKAIF